MAGDLDEVSTISNLRLVIEIEVTNH